MTSDGNQRKPGASTWTSRIDAPNSAVPGKRTLTEALATQAVSAPPAPAVQRRPGGEPAGPARDAQQQQKVMNRIIQERVASLGGLDRSMELSDETARAESAVCLTTSRTAQPTKQYLIQDAPPADVRAWLHQLPVDMQTAVSVLWPAMHSGLSVTFQAFVDVYDDLWYPGSDDVWVRPPSGAWLLELDHEEVIRFFGPAAS